MRAIRTFLLVGVLVIGIVFVLSFLDNRSDDLSKISHDEQGKPDVLGLPSEESEKTIISFSGEEFVVSWVKISNTDRLAFFSNLSGLRTARELSLEKSCQFLVSGGFYTSDLQPTGLLISDGREISPFRRNRLFDGIFSINYIGIPRITRVIPKDQLRIAVQSGPILFENLQAQDLGLKNDKNARRIVVMITGGNELIFAAFYTKDSNFKGPLLADLPLIVKEFDRLENVGISDAMNLDGGSASAFYSESVFLREVSPIGSFFCLTDE